MNKLSYNELTEKASKGPFEIMLDQMIYERLPCSVGDDERHLAWCYKKEDAQLITHCLNNFQPLLEALEATIEDLTELGKWNGCPPASLQGALATIKEATEVVTSVPEEGVV
jgi:hypothetical protein